MLDQHDREPPFQPPQHANEARRSRRGRCRPSAHRAAAASAPSRARWRVRARAFPHARAAPAGVSARSAKPTSASAAIAGPFNAGSAAASPEEAEARAAARLHRERDILERREAGQDRGDLERSRQAHRRARVHRQGRDILAGKHDAAGIGRKQPGNLVDQRRLAGAVRPDDGVQFARPDVERHVVGDDAGRRISSAALRGAAWLQPRPNLRHSSAATPIRPPRANSDDQHQQRPEDHLPVLGEAGQPFLGQQIGGGADDRAVERAQPAEQHHDDQFARALPGHVGGADELGGIGEQEAGQTAEHARDHIGRELKAIDVEADRRHARTRSRARRAERGRSASRRARGKTDMCRAGSEARHNRTRVRS